MQTILLLQFSSCWSVDLFRCVRLKQVSLNLAAGQPRASSLASWLASQESSSHGSLTVLTPLLFKCSKIQGLLAVWHLSHELAGLAHQASVDKQLQKTNVETTMQAMHTERKLFVVQTQTPPQTTTIKCRHDRLDPALAASGKQKRKTKARNQDETAKIADEQRETGWVSTQPKLTDFDGGTRTRNLWMSFSPTNVRSPSRYLCATPKSLH